MNLADLLKGTLASIRQARWDQQRERELQDWAVSRRTSLTRSPGSQGSNLVFLCEEFFHPDLRGFGGFGKTVKNIAEHFNSQPPGAAPAVGMRVGVGFPQGWGLVDTPKRLVYHGTDVVLRPIGLDNQEQVFHQYGDLLQQLNPRLMISIDWYPSYAIPAYALSDTPLLIWIHDPRDRKEWQQIAGVPDELKFRQIDSADALVALAKEKSVSIKRLLSLQRRLNRKIIFATTARTLVPRAERTYEIGPISAYWLPNPIEMPALNDAVEESERPTLLYLGRMDAVKRPWVAFELARRHPEVEVQIAGQAHIRELMEPWLQRYAEVPNLKFLGHVDGEQKDLLIRRCWGILNTSIHEAEPVSFLEAFAYGKCVISCHDPDQEVTNYGYYTGEVLGEGLDEEGIQKFSEQVRRLIGDREARHEKGRRARKDMLANHSFESFRTRLQGIMDAEGV